MNSFLKRLPSRRWLLLPPLAIGITVVAVLARSKRELVRVDVSEMAQPIEVLKMQSEPVLAEAIGYGTAKPRRLWSAIAEVGGRIVSSHPKLRSGSAVSAGEVLVVIDPTDYQLRADQRSAELDQARAQLQQLKLTQTADQRSLVIQQDLLKVRQDGVDRLQKLSDSSAASQSEADAAQAMLLQQAQVVQTLKNTLSTYPSQIASAEATVALNESRLKEARRDIDRTEIVAPFSGLLSGVSLEPDQYVAAREALFQIHDTGYVEIEAQFSMSQLARLIDSNANDAKTVDLSVDRKRSTVSADASLVDHFASIDQRSAFRVGGLSSTVIVRSGDMAMKYAGQPVRVTESLDEQTRTLGVVVRVHNEVHGKGESAHLLRPGSYCEVKLTSDRPTVAHVVPRTSVDSGSVFVVDKNNRLRRREVQVAFPLRASVAVTEGLFDGDLVVIDRPIGAIDGELVEPQILTPGERRREPERMREPERVSSLPAPAPSEPLPPGREQNQ